MDQNRSVNDIRQNLESILFNYYIKYTSLQNLVPASFQNLNNQANTIDIYIDVFDMLKSIYGREVYANKQYIIVSSVINLVAHMRNYFRKMYHMNTRIYLVYADNSSNNHKQFYAGFGDDTYKSTFNYAENSKLILSQLEMVKILVAYIYDVYFVEKKTMFSMFVYDNIIKNNGIPAIIITKSTYAYQIPALVPYAALFRPKKYKGEDLSYSVLKSNVLQKYYNGLTRPKTLEYMSRIDSSNLGLLMTLTGNAQCKMNSVVNASVAIRILSDAISSGRLLNSHMSDTAYIYSCIPELSKYMNQQSFIWRFNACDLIYQHLLYTQMPESMDYTWNVNFYDPGTVQDINNRYFVDNPLDLNSL